LKRSHLWIIIGISIFVVLIICVGFKETVFALKKARLSYIFYGFLLTVLGQQYFHFIKWIIMLKRIGMKTKIRETFFISSYILMSGIITPGRTGEFIIPFVIKEGKGMISSSVLFNRFIESFLTLLFAVIIFLFVFDGFIAFKTLLLIGMLFVCMYIILCVFVTKRRFESLIINIGNQLLLKLKRIRFLNVILKKEERFAKEIESFYQSNRSLFSWNIIFSFIFLTMLTWVVMIGANYAFFLSVGIDVPFKIILAVMILGAIGMFLSPTPAGIGLGDIPPVYFLYLNGYRENIGAFIIIVRVIVMTAAFLWYLLAAYFYYKKNNINKIRKLNKKHTDC